MTMLMLRHPDALAVVRSSPELTVHAVEEVFGVRADGRRPVSVRPERGPGVLSADERVLHRVRRPALWRPDRAHRRGGLRRGDALPVRWGRDRGSTRRLAGHARAPVRRVGARDGFDGLVRTRGRGGMMINLFAFGSDLV